jgi:type II secretory pathway pseudopilin PulG
MRYSLNRKGFTYLLALMLIMVMGIMLAAVGQSWKTVMKREREEELIFRGRQYKDAITRWYTPRAGSGQHVATPLKDLKDLLQDPRSLTITRYLRRLYTDPITGKEWNVISDPNRGITGVFSSSEAAPLKTGGFPDDLKELSDKKKYSEWQFVYIQAATSGTPRTTGTTGTTGKGGPSIPSRGGMPIR